MGHLGGEGAPRSTGPCRTLGKVLPEPPFDGCESHRAEVLPVSFFPCSLHGKRVTGPLHGAYPALLRNENRWDRRLRLCTACLTELLERHAKDWQDPDEVDGSNWSQVCYGCGSYSNGVRSTSPFFLSLYRRGQDRQDLYSVYCQQCSDALVDELGLELRVWVDKPT